MRASESGKGAGRTRRVVAVISSSAELNRAARLRQLPDFFELRLDGLGQALDELERAIGRLRAPLIVTARHPAEGAQRHLPVTRRRALLLRFLPQAAYVDVELRSISALADVLAEAERMRVKRIISVHDFRRTPSLEAIQKLGTRAAAAAPDVFKLVTRVDTRAAVDRLIGGFELLQTTVAMSAMGVGRFGRASRVELFARGSVLNYAHLGNAPIEGQLSLSELRRLSRAR
jgi:3-dehydroquinate dehydratase-1